MGITEIKDFQVLPVEVTGSTSPHYIYFKKHTVKGSSNENRSIFFFNLPIQTSTPVFKKYLQSVAIGATLESFTPSFLTDYPEDIWIDLTKLTSDLELESNEQLQEQLQGAKLPKHCGVVSFVDKSAFQLAFSSLKKLSIASTISQWPIPSFGSSFFLEKYHNQILDSEDLSNAVSQALVEFDAAEQQSMNEIQSQTQLVDEDGFTLVVGSHRKTKAGIMGKQKLASTVEAEKAQSKLKKKEKEDFYRFQMRQKKKDEMNDLLRKFKEDQERVRVMTEKKRFRPY
ncbi:ribosomal RNA-processing protein 7 [[Candida] anglica]|uniref:Ribosomal RNA-processing protein 7 n=1 Tax=[Candida] anglica TaxID=148631 RepID=A0ABP0EB39_9ASCO